MANILWIIHNYPPYQNAGAEWMAKEINTYLSNNGHKITVYSKEADSPYMDESVFVTPGTPIDRDISNTDIIITHLDQSYVATEIAQKHNKPIIHILHHSFEIPLLRQDIPNLYIVYNSAWVKAEKNYPHESIVVHPPVDPYRFHGISRNVNGYITMVNCNVDKGIMIFQQIARSTPNRKFLAVKGHHGPQITTKAGNITQWECQDDIRNVFKETDILLVPSIYESYGRIAIEAAACGIPVIASDTLGLRESLSYAGRFVSRNYLPAWIQQIRAEQVSEDVLRKRASVLWEKSKAELESLNNLINKLCEPI